MSETVREITERIRRHIDEPMTGGSVTAEDFASRDRTRSLCVPDAQLRLLLDALAARERELAEARADLAALEAVEAVEAFNDSGEGFLDIVPSGPRVAFAWSVNSVDSPIRVAGAPTLVALGRALLARKAGDAK